VLSQKDESLLFAAGSASLGPRCGRPEGSAPCAAFALADPRGVRIVDVGRWQGKMPLS